MSSTKRKATRTESDDKIQDAVDFLTADGEKKVRGNVGLSLHLDNLLEEAGENGLSRGDITALLKETAAVRWPESVRTKLIKCLLPRETVPIEGILHAVSKMCTNKPSIKMQSLLIRWMVMVYDLIEERQKLHALYGILFFFLESETMCPHVAHLLYLLTEEQDVTGHRVRLLLELQQQHGSKPHLIALLALYKLYCPNMVAVTLPSNRRVFFKHLDSKWVATLRHIQQRRKKGGDQSETTGITIPDSSILIGTSGRISSAAGKRRRMDILPEPPRLEVAKRSSRKICINGEETSSVGIEQIHSFEDFVKCVHCIEAPSQIGCVLTNPFMQYYMLLRGDSVLTHRLTYWLHHVLHQEFFEDSFSSSTDKLVKEQLLEAIFNFSEFIQEGIPVVENFLISYLQTWNGLDYRSRILQLITRIRPFHFAGLNKRIFEPLRKLYFCSSIYFKCQVLYCLTELLRNFTLVELPRLRQTLEIQHQRADPAVDVSQVQNLVSVFVEDVEEIDGVAVMSEIIDWVKRLITVTLLEHPDNPLLMYYTHGFYELVTSLYPTYGVNISTIPCRAFMYLSLFSGDSFTLCHVLRLAVRCRGSITSIRERSKKEVTILADEDKENREIWENRENRENEIPELDVTTRRSLETLFVSNRGTITPFNNYLRDFARALWQDKAAVDKTKDQSVFNNLNDVPLSKNVTRNSHRGFNLWNHPALIGYGYILTTEHPSGWSRNQWKRITKDEYLVYLTDMGLDDLNICLDHLIKRKGSETSRSQVSRTSRSEISRHENSSTVVQARVM